MSIVIECTDAIAMKYTKEFDYTVIDYTGIILKPNR